MVGTAPKYDGSTVFEFWARGLKAHFRACGIEEEEQTICAPLCLTGNALDYYNRVGVEAESLEEFLQILRERFGVSRNCALEDFFAMK